MTLSDHQWQFLQDVSLLVQFALEHGYKLTGGELWRTEEQQRIYLDRKLSKTMDSKHLKRLAIDLNVFVNGKLASTRADFVELATYWRSLSPHNVSGYDWGWDYNHFERKI
jgi:peptidoglycan L-alanyl-D-glutamate endopeptidase CwlK